jgi:hypothetical protein
LCIQDFEGRFFIVFYWVLPSFFYYIFCRLLSLFVGFCRILSPFVFSSKNYFFSFSPTLCFLKGSNISIQLGYS